MNKLHFTTSPGPNDKQIWRFFGMGIGGAALSTAMLTKSDHTPSKKTALKGSGRGHAYVWGLCALIGPDLPT